MQNPFMEYAAHNWGDHAHGEAKNQVLECEIVAFLRKPKTLASTVQTQYRDARLSYRRSLDCSKHTPIHVAVSFGLEHIVDALVRDAPDLDLNAEDEEQRTAFHWAAESGFVGCVRSLIEAGADIRTQDNRSYTALYKASAFGHASIVKMILEQDKTVKIKRTEINCAILSNQKLVIETYIQTAPKPAERANLVLMESSAFGKPDIIALALSLGADANVEDKKGRSVLLVAVNNGRSTAAQALIDAGTLTTVLDESGKNLLQVAASSQEIFRERLEQIKCFGETLAETGDLGFHQLPVHMRDDPCQIFLKRLGRWVGTTSRPLTDLLRDADFIANLNEDSEHPRLIRLLLAHGADLGILTSEGETLLHLAVGSAPRVKVLLELGNQRLDINGRDIGGRSALHCAAAAGNSAAMEVLLSNGASINLRDVGRAPILHYAVLHSACVKVAIENGSDIGAVDCHKRTALRYWGMIDDPPQEAFNQLQAAGVDSLAIDSQGMTAMAYHKQLDLGSYEFEETTNWIASEGYDGERYCLTKWTIGFMLRESHAQAEMENRRFFEKLNHSCEQCREWYTVPDDQMPTNSTG